MPQHRFILALVALVCLAPLGVAAPCTAHVELSSSPFGELPALIERLFSRPRPVEVRQAERQGGVLIYRFQEAGAVALSAACAEGSCPPPPDAFLERGEGEENVDCSDMVKKHMAPEQFARTTYNGKVASSLAVRSLSAPQRFFTNPSAFAGDLMMVFVSPAIKQSMRNRRLARGDAFPIHTVVTLLPMRMVLNSSVSALDALLAYGTARLDDPTLTHQQAKSHAQRRLLSNILSYVVLDSLTTGLDDHLVLDYLAPYLVRNVCTHVPNSRWAAITARGSIVVAYASLSSAWELIHYALIRGYLFASRDPKKP